MIKDIIWYNRTCGCTSIKKKTLNTSNTYYAVSSLESGLPPEKSIIEVQEALKAIVLDINIFMTMPFSMIIEALKIALFEIKSKYIYHYDFIHFYNHYYPIT